MKKILKPKEVLYDISFDDSKDIDEQFALPQYGEVYKQIKTSLFLDKHGYNIYLIDEFCKDRIKHIVDYVSFTLKEKKPPKDICYVIKEDPKEPVPLVVNNGYGKILKETLDKIQSLYVESIFKFYNAIDNKEKEELIGIIKDRRSKIVEDLIELSKSFGFDIKVGEDGFTFVPLNEGKEMTEDEYEELPDERKQEILSRVSELKISANNILEKLRNMSYDELDRIKEIMKDYLQNEFHDTRVDLRKAFKGDTEALSYLNFIMDSIEKEIISNYSINYEDDEEKIKEIIFKYDLNVVVDNSNLKSPPVIYEEDPSISNLLGAIEYENHNNMYVSTVDSIRVGSYVKANEGCLIIRANSLIENSQSYYYLKKSLLSGNVNLDYNRGYLELFTLAGLKPAPVEVKTKVILIGDYEVYNILYNYDKEFKNIFRLRSEYKGVLDINAQTKAVLKNEINRIIEENHIRLITSKGIKEISKFLSRKAESKDKIYFDYDEIETLLLLANYKAEEEKKEWIDEEDIISVAYKRDHIEKEYLKLYEENKLMLQVEKSRVGQINGLSVIDAGYTSFGKPTKITCTCWSGDGKIVDVQRESSLSGSIHTKGISTLKGYIYNLNDGFEKLPVDFNLNFEQLYGVVDGDSASAAEAIVIISALAKIPIKQNIAITGSINQFGEIQPIGGVNEKIEGFYNICKIKKSFINNGVIIPASNVSELVLSNEVEQAIVNGEFTIYSVDTVEEAMEIMYDIDQPLKENIITLINDECKKYHSSEEESK